MIAEVKTNKVKKFGKIAGNLVAALIIALIAMMLFFKLVPGFGFYVVKSGSMTPGIQPGDIVFTQPVADNLEVGSIITFEVGDELVTHRIVDIENGQIYTKGDANEDADTGFITAANIQGSYLFTLPKVGYLTEVTSTKKGWFLVVIVPTLILVGFIVRAILKEAFKPAKPVAVTAAAGAAVEAARTEIKAEKTPKKAAAQQPPSLFSFLSFKSEKPAAADNHTVKAVKAEPVAAEVKAEQPQIKKSAPEPPSLFSFLSFKSSGSAKKAAPAAAVKTAAEVKTETSGVKLENIAAQTVQSQPVCQPFSSPAVTELVRDQLKSLLEGYSR
jgi:signal peptidase